MLGKQSHDSKSHDNNIFTLRVLILSHLENFICKIYIVISIQQRQETPKNAESIAANRWKVHLTEEILAVPVSGNAFNNLPQ